MKITKREIMAWLVITIGGIALTKAYAVSGFSQFAVVAGGYALIFYAYVKLPRG